MKILLTTHGAFAKGILESYQMIAGPTNDVYTISLTHEGVESYRKELHKWLATQEEVLVLCDLKGGTPFNENFAYFLENPKKIRLIAGLNLPMLMEVALQLEIGLTLDEYAQIAYNTGKQEIFLAEDDEDDTFEF